MLARCLPDQIQCAECVQASFRIWLTIRKNGTRCFSGHRVPVAGNCEKGKISQLARSDIIKIAKVVRQVTKLFADIASFGWINLRSFFVFSFDRLIDLLSMNRDMLRGINS
jgi:hypothetical protein